MDDTLFPEMQYVKSGFKAVAAKLESDLGVNCYDTLLELFAADNKNVYDRTLDSLGVSYDKEYIAKLVSIYRGHTPQGLQFFPDVEPFIKELKNLGISVGLITDGRVDGQKKKLEALGCNELFDSIIITDELGGEIYRKPSDKAFEIMCADFKVGFGQTAYIGDNPAKDFYIGTKGVFTVRVKRNGALCLCKEEYYKGVAADLTVEGLS